jgi:hypothetical protein
MEDQSESLKVILEFSTFLRGTYQLPSHSPKLHEVRTIVREMLDLPESERTEKHLESLVRKHVNLSDEEQLLEGVDMSDLRLLQQQILVLLRKK